MSNEGFKEKVEIKPLSTEMVSSASVTKASRSRSGRSSSSKKRKGKKTSLPLDNIDSGVNPFNEENGCVDVCDAIELCQKAYWNVSIFRSTIDIQTEFANSKIHFKGKNKSANNFFTKWYEKINGENLGDQFFRELFRSSNILLYRTDAVLGGGQIDLLDESKRAKIGNKIPIKYAVLNPSEIKCNSNSSFIDSTYFKYLTPFEVDRLSKPQTEQERAIVKNLPEEVKKKIRSGSKNIQFVLDPEFLHTVFYKKQDYEPFSIPIYFSVLYDIDLKLELKKAESVIAKTTDYMILLITMGEEDNVSQVSINAMNELFQNESVGRVLVSDYTTKMEFVIPDLNKILGPDKYKVVNEDIANGLMNVFFTESKFSDSMAKIKIFLERLNEARRVYLSEFLNPEIRRISKELGFRNPPVAEFEEVDLKDEVEYMKIYNRLAELGFLTPDETFEAYESNKLPKPFESEENQQKFKEQREKGLYEPISGSRQEAGRPEGTPQKQKEKETTPVGASVASSQKFSISKFKDTLHDLDSLIEKVTAEYKKKFGVKRISKKHKATIESISFNIVSAHKKEDWNSKVEDFISGSFEINEEMIQEIESIKNKHQLSDNLSALMYHCEFLEENN